MRPGANEQATLIGEELVDVLEEPEPAPVSVLQTRWIGAQGIQLADGGVTAVCPRMLADGTAFGNQWIMSGSYRCVVRIDGGVGGAALAPHFCVGMEGPGQVALCVLADGRMQCGEQQTFIDHNGVHKVCAELVLVCFCSRRRRSPGPLSLPLRLRLRVRS